MESYRIIIPSKDLIIALWMFVVFISKFFMRVCI